MDKNTITPEILYNTASQNNWDWQPESVQLELTF